MYDTKALEKIGKKEQLVRKRELSIAKIIRKIGPLIYMARLLFDDKSLYFDTWKIYTSQEQRRKAEEREHMALKIQGRIRIKQVGTIKIHILKYITHYDIL